MQTIKAGMIVENIARAMVRTNDNEDIKYIWRVLNQVYFDLCSKYSWYALRATKDIDFTSATSSGLWLPANLLGIDEVRDYANEITYIPIDQGGYDPRDRGYRYKRFVGSETALYESGEDLTIGSEKTSFTCPALQALITNATISTVKGEFASFSSEPGLYEITNNVEPFTIAVSYNGDDLDDKGISIRPEGTEKISLIDPDEAVVDDATVTIHYWKLPRPLYRDVDPVVLPTSELLELATLIKMPEAKRARPISANQVEEVLQDALRINPNHRSSNYPSDVAGAMFTMKKGIWGARTSQ